MSGHDWRHRDAVTPATGYPSGLRIDGIELRDRVWLDREV
jgi:hypothetical protein